MPLVLLVPRGLRDILNEPQGQQSKTPLGQVRSFVGDPRGKKNII